MRCKEIVRPLIYDDDRYTGDSFGTETDGVVVETDYECHITANLEALNKQGYWQRIDPPVRIHTREIMDNYRMPLLLRVALYGQDSLAPPAPWLAPPKPSRPQEVLSEQDFSSCTTAAASESGD